MRLENKIAAVLAPIAALALLVATPASAQNAPSSTPPKVQSDASTPAAAAPPKKTTATRHTWSKKHHAKAENHPHKTAKTKATNEVK